jgi:hypothetical protein
MQSPEMLFLSYSGQVYLTWVNRIRCRPLPQWLSVAPVFSAGMAAIWGVIADVLILILLQNVLYSWCLWPMPASSSSTAWPFWACCSSAVDPAATDKSIIWLAGDITVIP